MIERLPVKCQRGRPKKREKSILSTLEFKAQKERLYSLFSTCLRSNKKVSPVKDLDLSDPIELLYHFHLITENQYERAQNYLRLYYQAYQSMGLKTRLKSQLGNFERFMALPEDRDVPYREKRWESLQKKLNKISILQKPLGNFLMMILTSPLQATLLRYPLPHIKKAFHMLDTLSDF